ncbi:MAG: precorrin-3B C(17)-methyltransferase, partial [Paracoccaceae bacterium]|nr:precorrin-3B C(17)-methyltransferase [Paracoccaceae bacterium]
GAGHAIIGVMAAGIVIRALASVLSDKTAEPPVLALAADGSSVVPLLGGHRGANALAETIAAHTGGHAARTTAGEGAFGIALDAPPPGWRVENEGAVRAVTAALLSGQPVSLCVAAGSADWLNASGAPFVSVDALDGTGPSVWVTDAICTPGAETVVLRPPVLALGIGCARGADRDDVIALGERALGEARLSPLALACVVSVDIKADEGAVHDAARHFGVPARFFDAARLEEEHPRLENPSDRVFAEVGCHGVSEGAALAAVGAPGTLALAKIKSADATAAIARAGAGETIDADAIGRPRGVLTVVGIGPGAVDWRTGEAARVLARATDVVGYGLYLDLVADLTGGAVRHTSNLAEEEARVRQALDLAAGGRRVALVSSGDAGIFALATLTFELLDREDRADWNRVALSVAPGVSAFQAAAARIGAPMGHDFCAISLSDLLTPWEAITGRLDAAGRGDFVVALYNPVSKRRRHQIAEARDILLRYRPRETPVVLGRNLGRADETVEVITLSELSAERADMLTMVVIGSSNTRHIMRGDNAWVYTPRGYDKKMDGKREAS